MAASTREQEEQLKNRARSLLFDDLRNFVDVSKNGLIPNPKLSPDFVGPRHRSITPIVKSKSSTVRNSMFVHNVLQYSPNDHMLLYILPTPEILEILTLENATVLAALIMFMFNQEPYATPPNAYQCSLLCGFEDGASIYKVEAYYRWYLSDNEEERSNFSQVRTQLLF